MIKELPENPKARNKILDLLFNPKNQEYLDMLKEELLLNINNNERNVKTS